MEFKLCRLDNRGVVNLLLPFYITATFFLLLFIFSIKTFAVEELPDNGIGLPDLTVPEKDIEILVPEEIYLNSYNLVFNADNSQPFALRADIMPEGSEGSVTWISNNPAVALVVDGLVVPVGNGTCDIIATVFTPAGAPVMASCQVTCEDLLWVPDSGIGLLDEKIQASSLDEFLNEEFEVDRFQYEILEFQKFAMYVLCFISALLIIQIVRSK